MLKRHIKNHHALDEAQTQYYVDNASASTSTLPDVPGQAADANLLLQFGGQNMAPSFVGSGPPSVLQSSVEIPQQTWVDDQYAYNDSIHSSHMLAAPMNDLPWMSLPEPDINPLFSWDGSLFDFSPLRPFSPAGYENWSSGSTMSVAMEDSATERVSRIWPTKPSRLKQQCCANMRRPESILGLSQCPDYSMCAILFHCANLVS